MDNIIKIASITDSPSVMTASGWRIKDGQAKLDLLNSKAVRLLRKNLGTIGEAAITAPTSVQDILNLITVIRHPVQTGKIILKSALDALWFLKNPKAVKVYHGNKLGEIFPLQKARTASSTDVGIHVSPKREIAKSLDFRDVGLMEAWIPEHNMETLDLGYNNYYLISNEVNFPFNRNKTFTKFELNILRKYGDRNIPLRNETMPNLSRDLIIEAERLVNKGKKANNGSAAKEVNLEVSDFLSNHGMKVIKYNNLVEGGGGISYIITDPKVFYTLLKYNWSLIFNYSKYPLIYENNK